MGGVLSAQSFDEAMELLNNFYWEEYIGEIFVIGGKTLIDECIRRKECKSVFVTRISREF
jgi:dihydrofolate reductase